MLAQLANEIQEGKVVEWREQGVAIEVAITTRNRLVVGARIDIINHRYIQALDVWELEKRQVAKKRRMRIIKVYNNRLQEDKLSGKVGSTSQRRTLADANWGNLLEGRVTLLEDFNAHSPD